MNDLIDRGKFANRLTDIISIAEKNISNYTVGSVESIADNLIIETIGQVKNWLYEEPSAGAEPVRHAHWELVDGFQWETVYRCSACGRDISISKIIQESLADYPYCHCGARMDEEVPEK